MKWTVFKKFIICIFICVGVAIVSDHMPQFIRAVYDGIFQTTVNISIFVFIVGLFIFEILFFRKRKGKKQCYICLGVAFIAASLMLFNGHSSLYNKLMPSVNTTLLGRVDAETEQERRVFMQYYFNDKNLIISEEENENRKMLSDIYLFSVSPQNIISDEEAIVSEKMKKKVLSRPYYLTGQYLFVVDEYWKDTDSIRVIQSDEEYIFCSQEFWESVSGQNEGDSVLLKTEVTGFSLDVINETENDDVVILLKEVEQTRPYKKLKQVIVMLSLLAMGLTFTLSIWGNDYPILAFFLGLPIAVAGICIYGIVLMMFNIPFNFFTVLGGGILVIGVWLYRNRNVYRTLDWKLLIDLMLVAIGAITLLVYAEICCMSPDSIMKCVMAYRLAKFGTLRDILAYAMPYGMLEPIVMSIGYMVHCDLLYTLYPLMAISGVGVMYAGIHYSNKKADCNMAMLALGCGIVLLISNYDFLLSSFFVLSHGLVAVYTLIYAVFIVMKKQLNIPWFEEVVVMALTIILVTRVEGAIYVLFMLIVPLGLENEYLKMQKSNVIMAAIVIAWNVYQIIYIAQRGNPYFWRPDRGILLIGASIVVLAVTFLMGRQWKLVNNIRKNYFLMLMTAVIGMTVLIAVFMKRSLAIANFPVYIAHFTNSVEDDTNSAALWSFMLLSCPAILGIRNKVSRYAVTSVLGYIILIFAIFLFRNSGTLGNELPIRLSAGDSARRMIVHIMPTAVWLLAYCIGEADYAIKEKA